jgi:hypothetical protein
VETREVKPAPRGPHATHTIFSKSNRPDEATAHSSRAEDAIYATPVRVSTLRRPGPNHARAAAERTGDADYPRPHDGSFESRRPSA